ncbi:MBL fold metallo-hydrolase [bacterium]|nr:MBL fold metallo-hydrolase [bacterium]
MNDKKWIPCILFILLGAGVHFACTPTESELKNMFQAEKEVLKEVTLISVYDNYQTNPELKTGWGFGTVVKTPQESILFDTGGDSDILLSNMEKIKIDPGSIDMVFISHVHGDHVGGLKGFLEKNNHVTVFIPASFPTSIRNMITAQGAEFVDVSQPQKISDCIFSTGEIDGPPIEQSLIIQLKKGLVVMTGCGHPGIERIVQKTKNLFPELNVYMGIGGFHRPSVDVVQALQELGVEKIAPSHCTGDRVIEAFREAYQDNFIRYGVGKIIEINE